MLLHTLSDAGSIRAPLKKPCKLLYSPRCPNQLTPRHPAAVVSAPVQSLHRRERDALVPVTAYGALGALPATLIAREPSHCQRCSSQAVSPSPFSSAHASWVQFGKPHHQATPLTQPESTDDTHTSESPHRL